jgi:diguanylate cyclase (GGDEF)-like protein
VLDKGHFRNYRYDPTNLQGISSNTIRTIAVDRKDQVWIGTVGGGIMRYNASTDSFEHYLKVDGLPDNIVKSILVDDSGTVWIGTPRGIGYFEQEEKRFRSLTVYYELRDRDFHTGAWRGVDGTLYFGGLNAVYQIRPDRVPIQTVAPMVRLSSLHIASESQARGIEVAYLDHLDLDYTQNSFALSFMVNDYRDPSANRFLYRLEGYDSDWRSGNGDRRVEYTNVPGGNYTFRVRASNADGVWTPEGLAIPVRVASAPWLSPLAFSLYLIVLIGLGYLIASLRGKKNLETKVLELIRVRQELEELNQQLEELSMEDTLTGLANRRRLDAFMAVVWADAQREQYPIALLMIDLDRFKEFNDHYGHIEGDRALRLVARAILGCTERATDLAVRYGGEELIVVLPRTPIDAAFKIAERIRISIAGLSLPHPIDGREFLTVSIGVAALTPAHSNIPQSGSELSLIQAADEALYRAKSAGRDQIKL